jgi:gentisate 1,2-dioxygenase
MNEFRKNFAPMQGQFLDRTGVAARDENTYWPPIIINKKQMDAEAERLASLPMPDNGRRESLIVHPLAAPNAPGFAPGIQVKLSVLKPGEISAPFRHNATEVNFCIGGSGHTLIDGKQIAFEQYDVWNHPSYRTYRHANDGKELQVRLTYSNVPLLQHMQVYIPDDKPGAELQEVSAEDQAAEEAHRNDPRRKNPFGMPSIGAEGAMLMPYEVLINPKSVESRALHFPWKDVQRELDKLVALGKDYVGRRLYMMYNPVTTRFNGATPNFFATMTIRPPKIVDRPHRHSSAAINYYFHGSGYSMVAGNRYEWQAGDLMLSAPGWAVHNHAAYDDHVYELTIQDQPLNIFMESLLWQEDQKRPALVLGAESGFETNRTKVAA